jgi:hypothetical protein
MSNYALVDVINLQLLPDLGLDLPLNIRRRRGAALFIYLRTPSFKLMLHFIDVGNLRQLECIH